MSSNREMVMHRAAPMCVVENMQVHLNFDEDFMANFGNKPIVFEMKEDAEEELKEEAEEELKERPKEDNSSIFDIMLPIRADLTYIQPFYPTICSNIITATIL